MNQTTITKQRGLSDFALKYFAMVCMILDHIHYFFSFTGKIPLFFSWIGRLAAPLFLFCIVEGFLHTHDRKKYFLRIYAIAIFMGLVQFSFYNIASGLVRPGRLFPAESDACILFRPARRSLGHRPVSEKTVDPGTFCHPDSGLSALSSVRAVRRICSLWHSLRQFSLKPSGVQCPALPHCDHRRWHRHTARRRDSLPDAQTPPIAGRCLCTFRACVGHPARAAFYARRNFYLFLFYRCL